MKNKISNIWAMLNSSEEKTRKKGEELFNEWDIKLTYEYDIAKNFLDKNTKKILENKDFFHDYYIEKIVIDNMDCNLIDIYFILVKKDEKYKLLFETVTKYTFDIKNVDDFINKIEVGYLEIYKKKNFYKIIVTCDILSYFCICCKNIKAEINL